MYINKRFKDWLESKDSYGNQMIGEWEKGIILKRAGELADLEIIEGDLMVDAPNEILVDISRESGDDFQPKKIILISLSHYIRPCPCDCHEWQYQCYLEDCACCTDECT